MAGLLASPRPWRSRSALLTRGGRPAAADGSLVRIDPTAARRDGASRGSRVAGRGRGRRRQRLGGRRPHPGALAVQPADRHVHARRHVGRAAFLAVLGGKVYVASDGPNAFSGTVVRYDAATGHREGGVEVQACTIASGEGVVWVAGCPFVDRLSTDDGPLRRIRHVFIPYPSPADGGERPRPVPRTRTRRRFALGARRRARPAAVAARPAHAARSGARRASTSRRGRSSTPRDASGSPTLSTTASSPSTRERMPSLPASDVCRGAAGIAATRGSLWVACSLDGAVDRIGVERRSASWRPCAFRGGRSRSRAGARRRLGDVRCGVEPSLVAAAAPSSPWRGSGGPRRGRSRHGARRCASRVHRRLLRLLPRLPGPRARRRGAAVPRPRRAPPVGRPGRRRHRGGLSATADAHGC